MKYRRTLYKVVRYQSDGTYETIQEFKVLAQAKAKITKIYNGAIRNKDFYDRFKHENDRWFIKNYSPDNPFTYGIIEVKTFEQETDLKLTGLDATNKNTRKKVLEKLASPQDVVKLRQKNGGPLNG
ncbi:MAG: hypothetical protein R3309_01705 [Reinekea sp.]|nr:hypothetical protein [Reinekea sp.]